MRFLFRDLGLLLWMPVVVLLAWWFGTANSTSVYVPSLQVILETFVRDWMGERFLSDALRSIAKFQIGRASCRERVV